MTSSKADVVVAVNGETAPGEKQIKVGVKRKRTPSLEDDASDSSKRKEVPNGVTAVQDGGVGDEATERVAILDAGAQYGKVGRVTCVCCHGYGVSPCQGD